MANEDTGSTIRVVPNWDIFRLARASRFYYRGTAQDLDLVADVQDVGGSFRVVQSLESWRGARSSQFYYRTPPQDLDAPVLLVETFAPFLVRLPFRGLRTAGLMTYLRTTPWDGDAPPVTPDEGVYIPTYRPRRR